MIAAADVASARAEPGDLLSSKSGELTRRRFGIVRCMSRKVPGLVIFALLLLAGCSSLQPRQQVLPPSEVSAVAREAELARQAWLAANPRWSLQGRAAVSKGRSGGSGKLDWQQAGEQYRIQLSAPVTRQSWVLDGDMNTRVGRLQGLQGGVRAGEDAEQVLLEATGWQIPVNSLPDWLRGRVVDVSGVDVDAEGRPLRLRQHDWEVDYLEWYPAQDARPPLPRRIEARSGDAKVRLVIDQWDDAEP